MADGDRSVGTPVVQAVRLAQRYRIAAGTRLATSSRPGHLLQLTLQGGADYVVSGRRYRLQPGRLVWLHETETVEGVVGEGGWQFCSANFIAPGLAPPPHDRRVIDTGLPVSRAFDRLLEAWDGAAGKPHVRQLRVQAAMLDLLGCVLDEADVEYDHGMPFQVDPAADAWWQVEARVRENIAQPLSMDDLVAMSGRSAATLKRACRHAVARSPMRRIKEIRLNLARGLVRHSDLRIGQIADRVGYARIHEFSRDYRRMFGASPTQDRPAGK